MDGPTIYDFPPFRLDASQRQLLRDGVPMRLGARAFDLLLALIERRGRTVGKHELLDLVWAGVVVEENNLEVQIVALRKLLGYPAIATVPGRGYRFTVPLLQDGVSARPPGPEAVGATPGIARPAVSNVPRARTRLFGRDEDLRQLLDVLKQQWLVTLTGPTGIGKTRLALAAAQDLLVAGEEVWWVDLTPMTDAALIPGALAAALALHLAGTHDAWAAVVAALSDRSPLIVLDNAEHLLAGVAAFVMRVTQQLPRARLLVTSQEPLRIDNEQVIRAEPLSLPADDQPAHMADSSAVALFVARAQAVDRRFELAGHRLAVADICRRLDGIPLAIELAAARVPMLGVEGLRDKLDQRFHILTAGRRSAPARHHTLRSALEWSVGLLGAAEQRLLRRLSVFAGGFTLEAAQQVAEDDDGLDRWDVLEHLGGLIEKSLVVAEGDDTPRYRLLETTRLFAMERLIESGESARARTRHREHHLVLAEDAADRLLFGDTHRHLVRLDLERDNLLLALAWANGPDEAAQGLRLAAALNDYWFLRGMPARGADLARAALDRAGTAAPARARGRAWLTAGWLSLWAGQPDTALRDLGEALALARSLGEPRLLCLVLTRKAQAHWHLAQREAAATLVSEAVDLGRPLGDGVELGYALVLKAHIQVQRGDEPQGEALYREALALRARMNNPSGMLAVHLSLAGLFTLQRSLPAARTHLQQALALLPVADSRFESLSLIGQTAQWAALAGHAEAAVLLAGVETHLFARTGFSLPPVRRGQAAIDRARAELSRAGALLDDLDAMARNMTHEQAMARVRSLLDSDVGERAA